MYPKDRIIITTGTFNPISIQEINFLKRCRRKGDWMIVGVHTDFYLEKRMIRPIQNFETRQEVVRNLKCVDEVFTFSDKDGTVCQLLKLVKVCYPQCEITFISEREMIDTPEKKIRGINFEVIR